MIIYISLGSNINAEDNIRSVLAIIKAQYPNIIISPMYQTSAVGFKGDDFLNCVAKIDTDKTALYIYKWFRKIEVEHGRDRNQPKFSSRSLDIDMLTYDDQLLETKNYSLPRDEITKYAFVLKPLMDIAPDEIHPVYKLTYLALWKNFSDTSQNMKKVAFSL